MKQRRIGGDKQDGMVPDSVQGTGFFTPMDMAPGEIIEDFTSPDEDSLCDRCGFAEWRHRDPNFACSRSSPTPPPADADGELTSTDVLCGNASDNIYLTFKGGCRKSLTYQECYRCTGCGGRFHKDCILEHFKLEESHDWGRQQERQELNGKVQEAIDNELDRLNGFLEMAQLCENDLDRMLIWVKNAKWALVAPAGKDTQAPSEQQGPTNAK